MTKNQADETPILDLDELFAPAARFVLDGRAYELKRFSALGLDDQHWLNAHYRRMSEISQAKRLARGMKEEYEQIVRDMLPRISSIPASVAASVVLEKAEGVVAAFFTERLVSQSRLTSAIGKALGANPTGATSSPGSTDSGQKGEPTNG